jgi:hypothetical protein
MGHFQADTLLRQFNAHEFKFTGSVDVLFSIEIVVTLLGIETQLVSIKVLSRLPFSKSVDDLVGK